MNDLVEKFYSKASKKCSRSPHPLALMKRIHLPQHWYSLSDPHNCSDWSIASPIVFRLCIS